MRRAALSSSAPARALLPFPFPAANILFTDDGMLKLADFGLSVDMDIEMANTCAGTLSYM